jgi:hypothetical protein
MSDAVLTLNAGSSSIKFALFALPQNRSDVPKQALMVGRIDGIGAAGRHARLTAEDATGERMDDIELPFEGPAESQCGEVLRFLVRWLREHEAGWRVTAVGHRVVHGGRIFSAPILLDLQVLDMLRGFIPLAPLHQPHNLAGIDAMADALPGVPQVACFDTAFHRTQPDIAQMFALPRRITAEGVLRYGFHGLSYEFIADVLPQHLPAMQADGRVIVAHLGNGASMCGMVARRSQATSMGFTAVDGLMMGTRTGSLDPGVLLYLMEHHGMDAQGADPPAVQRIGPAGRLRPVVGHAHAARIGDCRGEAGGRPVLLSGGKGNRLAVRGHRRHRRSGIHRRHRRARGGRPRKDLPAACLDRPRVRRRRQHSLRDAHQHTRQPRGRLRNPDQRRVDDRAAHRRTAVVNQRDGGPTRAGANGRSGSADQPFDQKEASVTKGFDPRS